MQLRAQHKVHFDIWPKSCEDCAVKRGWGVSPKEVGRPFMCVHRKDEHGQHKVCAGVKKIDLYNWVMKVFGKERADLWAKGIGFKRSIINKLWTMYYGITSRWRGN